MESFEVASDSLDVAMKSLEVCYGNSQDCDEIIIEY